MCVLLAAVGLGGSAPCKTALLGFAPATAVVDAALLQVKAESDTEWGNQQKMLLVVNGVVVKLNPVPVADNLARIHAAVQRLRQQHLHAHAAMWETGVAFARRHGLVHAQQLAALAERCVQIKQQLGQAAG